MLADGFRGAYPNGGAYAFARGTQVGARGWALRDDPTIRPEARSVLRILQPEVPATLARAAVAVWQQHLPGVVWVMPMTHWAYELRHGGGAALESLVRGAGIDPGSLRDRADGSAIEFAEGESAALAALLEGLPGALEDSDFLLAFPGRPALCMVHHHGQLWWTTSDARLLAALEGVAILCGTAAGPRCGAGFSLRPNPRRG